MNRGMGSAPPSAKSSTALGLLGLGVGLVGILATFYTFEIARIWPEPVYVELADRVRKTDTASATESRLEPTMRPEPTESTTHVSFYFWNRGRRAIRRTDVLVPLRLCLLDSSAKIVGCRVLRQSRNDVVRGSLRIDSTANAVILDFNILEQNDGIAGEVVFAGKPTAKLSMTGAVEGARAGIVKLKWDVLSSVEKQINWRLLGAAILYFAVVVPLIISGPRWRGCLGQTMFLLTNLLFPLFFFLFIWRLIFSISLPIPGTLM